MLCHKLSTINAKYLKIVKDNLCNSHRQGRSERLSRHRQPERGVKKIQPEE